MSEQTAAANWARTLPRLRRNAQELLKHGWEVKEPPNAETPPHKRGLPLPAESSYSTGMRAGEPGKDGTPPLHTDRTLEDRT